MQQLNDMNYEMAWKLISRGACIDHKNEHGKTALHYAIENKNMESI